MMHAFKLNSKEQTFLIEFLAELTGCKHTAAMSARIASAMRDTNVTCNVAALYFLCMLWVMRFFIWAFIDANTAGDKVPGLRGVEYRMAHGQGGGSLVCGN